jgi:ADP-ribose pyrophosphatase YjhB (NUDIX family)
VGESSIDLAQRLLAIAQNGLTYSLSAYDTERYEEVRKIGLELLAAGSGADIEELRGAFVMERGYATPKVDVRGAAFRDGRILLVREREDGRWSLPGGWADIGQSPAECVEREILEESGFKAKAVKLIAVLDRDRHGHPPIPFHAYKLFFLCELTGGSAAAREETTEVGFFGPDEIPALSLTRLVPDQIRMAFRYAMDPSLPTRFD